MNGRGSRRSNEQSRARELRDLSHREADMGVTTSAGSDLRTADAPTTQVQLAGFSPTEVAAVLADRLLPSRPPQTWGGWRVVSSNRRVNAKALALLTLETLVGALRSAGAIELSMRQRDGVFKSHEAAHLQLLPGVRPGIFPHQAPEARVIAWLASRPERGGWLDEAIAGTLIAEESSHPDRTWLHEVHHGLVARRRAREETRTILRFIRVRTCHLLPATHESLGEATDQAIARLLDGRNHLDTHQSRRCHEAWQHAVWQRRIDNSV